MTRLATRSLLTSTACAAAATLAFLAGGSVAHAQSAIIYGNIGNFDISNDTGETCHGFEIEIEGVDISTVGGGFSAERYGAPTVSAYPGGVRVRWASAYNAASGTWAERTLPHTVPWFPGQCYQWSTGPGFDYQASGCEHFGSWTSGNPSAVHSHWLCEDPANPGQLVPHLPATAVPFPQYYVQPPVVAGDPPQLVVEVQAPEPAEAPELYGDAQWTRVFEVQLPRLVTLDELVADNPNVVPMNLAQLEADYQIIQDEPVAGGNGRRRRHQHVSTIEPTTRSVVRRIETYAFTGVYDAVTHEALCADGLCDAPAADELGELISVQMTAATVQPDALIVTRTGSGSIDSADRRIACGSKCAASYDAGAVVTLTAKPASNNTFAGWTGACAGTGTCLVTMSAAQSVTATFTLNTFLLTANVTQSAGQGSVTASPAGTGGITACIAAGCTSTYNFNTSVTLTASLGTATGVTWTGCDSTPTATTCVVLMTAVHTVDATFTGP